MLSTVLYCRLLACQLGRSEKDNVFTIAKLVMETVSVALWPEGLIVTPQPSKTKRKAPRKLSCRALTPVRIPAPQRPAESTRTCFPFRSGKEGNRKLQTRTTGWTSAWVLLSHSRSGWPSLPLSLHPRLQTRQTLSVCFHNFRRAEASSVLPSKPKKNFSENREIV